MKNLQYIRPELVLRLVGGSLLTVGLFWLLLVFMAYIMFEVTVLDTAALHASLPRLGIVVSECSMLFVLFIVFGVALADGSRIAWRHCLAAAIIWLILGVYLAGLWVFYAPLLNVEVLQRGNVSSQAITAGTELILFSIIALMVAFPLLVISLLRLPSVHMFMAAQQRDSNERLLTDLVLLWGFWGLAVLTMLGVVFDERSLFLSQEGTVAMSSVWWVLTILEVLAGSCIFSRKEAYWRRCMAGVLLFSVVAICLAWHVEYWQRLMPESKVFHTMAVGSLVYFSIFAVLLMCLNSYHRKRHERGRASIAHPA